MYYLKQLLTLMTVSCLYIGVQAQCSVTKKAIDDGVGYETKFESIYKNEDLENGILAVHYKMNAIEIKQGSKIHAIIMITNKRPKEPIVARKLQIKIQRGRTVELDADTFEVQQLMTGTTSNLCSFRLTPEQFRIFMTNNIESLTINDTRTSQKLYIKPYGTLVKEQAQCLNKELIFPY